MVPSFYAGTNATSLCGLVRAQPALAAARMRKHLTTAVGEKDFAWLAEHGFNAVRVPVGYWTALGGHAFASRGSAVAPQYVPVRAEESLAALDSIFSWSRKHGLRVLLDMHGAPASQNGADHSGCDYHGIGWGDSATTVDLTLAALETLAARFGSHKVRP